MRVKSPEEMIRALENCASYRTVCRDCPYSMSGTCLRDIKRDAAEIIRALLNDLATKTEAEDDRHERSALNLLRAFKAMANAMNVDAGITIKPGATATDADLEDAIDYFLPRKNHPDKDTNVPIKNKTCE